MLAGKAVSTVRDACNANDIDVNTEGRNSIIKMFRQTSKLVKSNAASVNLITVVKASRLIKLMDGDPDLVEILSGLRDALPPAVHNHDGSMNDVDYEYVDGELGEGGAVRALRGLVLTRC